MEISVDNLLKIPAKYLSEYLYILTQTALGRVPTYALVNAKTSIQGVGANRVDEGLWMFLLVSLIFGWILQSIPAGSSNPPTIGITILILACWVAFSAVSYGFCHLIGGRGEFLASLSAMLQVLGAVYVVSSFGSLVLGVCFDVVGHRTYRYFFYSHCSFYY